MRHVLTQSLHLGQCEIVLWCWPKKDTGSTKGLIEKQIYSSNRNKIQVNPVKSQLVGRKLRVQCGSDYPSTTQMVSHVIVSRWLVHSPSDVLVDVYLWRRASPLYWENNWYNVTFKRNFTDLNSKFSFPLTGCYTKAKTPMLFCYLSVACVTWYVPERGKVGLISLTLLCLN